ncbi:MAG: hypothetical protein ACKOAD_04545 [Gammaproteobacteria bacterium]
MSAQSSLLDKFDSEKELKVVLEKYTGKPFTEFSIHAPVENMLEAIQTLLELTANAPQRFKSLVEKMLQFEPWDYEKNVYPALLNAAPKHDKVGQAQIKILADNLMLLCRFAKKDSSFILDTYKRHIEHVASEHRFLKLDEKKKKYVEVLSEISQEVLKKITSEIGLDINSKPQKTQ